MTKDTDIKHNLSDEQFERYYRQILLPEVGEQGQQALLEHHIIVIGAGGLGSHVSQQLGAAGIGYLYLVDDDNVERSNLPRQILFDEASIGQTKVSCVTQRIALSNPDLSVTPYCESFTFEFAEALLNHNAELQHAYAKNKLWVLDCSDNMATRQIVNLWCSKKLIGFVAASVSTFSGQLMVINGNNNIEAGCYHCVFPTEKRAQNCASVGVLGPTVAIMASMQALTVIKHILCISSPDAQLHMFDAITLGWKSIYRHRDPQCHVCKHWSAVNTKQSATYATSKAIL